MSTIWRHCLAAAVRTAFFFALPCLGALSPYSKVVATVNGEPIKEEVVIAGVNKKLPMTSFHANVSKPKLQNLRQQVLENLIEEELLYQEARKRKLQVSQSTLRQQIELMKRGYVSDKAFRQELEKTGLSYREWVARVERHLLIERIENVEIIDRTIVTDAEALAYYELNREKFVVPNQLKLWHILVSVDPGAMTAGWKAGSEKAQKIFERIQAGEDFARTAKEVSDDTTSRTQGGDVGWIHEGQLLDQLDESVRNLRIGDTGKPIRSIYGYHIFKLEGRQTKKQLRFDEIDAASLREKLRGKQIEERRQEFISDLRSRAEIRIFE